MAILPTGALTSLHSTGSRRTPTSIPAKYRLVTLERFGQLLDHF
ncbi:hypothetical protein AB8O38_07650 [Saccharomonospora xinjiangensis]